MLTPDDRAAIDGLFDWLADVESKAPPRDRDAEALIRDRLAAQPGAPYYLAQAVLVQEQALARAAARIEELEAAATSRDRDPGFLGGFFGNDRNDRRPPARSSGRWNRGSNDAPTYNPPGYGDGGGGFLAGAAQTALGVTTGVLMGSALASLLGGSSANAAEAGPWGDANGADSGNSDTDANADTADQGDTSDSGMDDGGDLGGDMGGDFDVGGDF